MLDTKYTIYCFRIFFIIANSSRHPSSSWRIGISPNEQPYSGSYYSNLLTNQAIRNYGLSSPAQKRAVTVVIFVLTTDKYHNTCQKELIKPVLSRHTCVVSSSSSSSRCNWWCGGCRWRGSAAAAARTASCTRATSPASSSRRSSSPPPAPLAPAPRTHTTPADSQDIRCDRVAPDLSVKV